MLYYGIEFPLRPFSIVFIVCYQIDMQDEHKLILILCNIYREMTASRRELFVPDFSFFSISFFFFFNELFVPLAINLVEIWQMVVQILPVFLVATWSYFID